MRLTQIVVLHVLAWLVCGCTPLRQYRTNYEPCVSADPDTNCVDRAIQEYPPSGDDSAGYMLGIVEFDDQGQLFDRAQLFKVIDHINQEAAAQDFIAVVFVHGWKHNAEKGDDNITDFRGALLKLSKAEHALSKMQGQPVRRIVGIYLGWRGLSVYAPVAKEFTFWERKNTAHKVGHGEVSEVLDRLDLIRQSKDAQSSTGHSRSRLVVVGHSFGGAVVFSATEQLLESRFIAATGSPTASSNATGFGNLVVLINPAFEALLYSPLSDMSTERKNYPESQLPVLAVLTSEADEATKIAFPAGRWFSTRFEKERANTRYNPTSGQNEIIKEGDTNVAAIGHFAPYQTHTLTATVSASQVDAMPTDARVKSIAAASQAWEHDSPGSNIQFPGSVLVRDQRTPSRDPYLIVKVDKALIPDHTDIWDSRVQEFLADIILISSQNSNPEQRKEERDRAQQ
jgi:pimeloyl-ACP methyl ester carboxylesterase